MMCHGVAREGDRKLDEEPKGTRVGRRARMNKEQGMQGIREGSYGERSGRAGTANFFF
jgi:hypothetical protein